MGTIEAAVKETLNKISEAMKNYDMSGRNQVSRPNREESVENSEGHAP